ncbi:hypothetical protein D9758_010952 [Tetrapyrgos nigripes]|uniref:Uncharacterized protein n=1 Tax=Tetrapyrgos nigripes TaxID=182062 RepID=A0A8H5CUP9_9AGAR|nr:hypothetical protein D9758_010952 [Tetrapyrgos nigripes]
MLGLEILRANKPSTFKPSFPRSRFSQDLESIAVTTDVGYHVGYLDSGLLDGRVITVEAGSRHGGNLEERNDLALAALPWQTPTSGNS